MKSKWNLGAMVLIAIGFTANAQNTREGEFLVKAPRSADITQFKAKLLSTHTDVKLIDKRHKIFLVNRPVIERPSFSFQQVTNTSPKGSVVEPNMELTIHSLPNDPGLNMQMNLVGRIENPSEDCGGQLVTEAKSIGMEKVFASSPILRQQAVVAVIDTGVNLIHPDLMDSVFINESEAQGSPGVDDDGNGYVDDISGYDFVNDRAQGSDDHGHGSHVAGIIAATTNNNEGVAGISDTTLILPLKFLGANGSGSLAGAIEAIEYARIMEVDVINASFGGTGHSEIFQSVISEAASEGILFVAAAGNSNQDIDMSPTYPAAYDDVIAVSATSMLGNLTEFSNYGASTVEIAAPGENILSPIIGESYGCFSGTSMAAPHVSGALALAKGVFPEETSQDLTRRLLTSADQLTQLRGLVKGARFLRVDKMLE